MLSLSSQRLGVLSALFWQLFDPDFRFTSGRPTPSGFRFKESSECVPFGAELLLHQGDLCDCLRSVSSFVSNRRCYITVICVVVVLPFGVSFHSVGVTSCSSV